MNEPFNDEEFETLKLSRYERDLKHIDGDLERCIATVEKEKKENAQLRAEKETSIYDYADLAKENAQLTKELNAEKEKLSKVLRQMGGGE